MSDDKSDYDDETLTMIAETQDYAVLVGEDSDGEKVYNVQLGNLTLHLFEEEWDELVALIQSAARK